MPKKAVHASVVTSHFVPVCEIRWKHEAAQTHIHSLTRAKRHCVDIKVQLLSFYNIEY